ncbi:MAG: hypothetical protein JNL72_09650 [Flavipsychrobacter sp.]|nr:hypothetical protein [Flavipsychrobacter sp.]
MATLQQVHAALKTLTQSTHRSISLDTLSQHLNTCPQVVRQHAAMLSDLCFAEFSTDGNSVRLTETGRLACIDDLATAHPRLAEK